MKYFLLVGAALLLASCAHPNTPPPPKAEPIGLDSPIKLRLHADDSGYTPSQVVRRRLFGLLPPKAAPLPELAGVPRKCKGCTFNLVAGNQTNSTVGKKATAATAEGATAIAAAKKAGPVVLADSGAVVQVATSGKGPAAAAGRDASATVLKPPTPWLKYALWAGTSGFVVWVVCFGGGATLWALVRRNKRTANQA